MTFDEALAALLALIGERVEVHLFEAAEVAHLVASFGGVLSSGQPLPGARPMPGSRSS